MSTTVVAIHHAISAIDRVLSEPDYVRPSRQSSAPALSSAPTQACTRCRSNKRKCITTGGGQTCAMCSAEGEECVYPTKARPGRRKGSNRRIENLRETRAELVAALASLGAPLPTEAVTLSGPSLTTQMEEDSASSTQDDRDREELGELSNPLAVMADLALRREGRGRDEVQGEEAWLRRSEDFYAGGIYAARPEMASHLELDPIKRGILSQGDLDRLVALYFRCLWGSSFLLDPVIHSPTFLRQTSPFLTTTICAIAAMYCQLSSDLVQPLLSHAHFVSVRIFEEGFKSVEICQSLLLLVNWAPPASNWTEDRSWVWMGQALRIASEIRLGGGFDDESFQHLGAVTKLPAGMYSLLAIDRERTWSLLFSTELVMSVNTGRLPVTGFLKLPDISFTPRDPAHPMYAYYASEALDRTLAASISDAVNMPALGLPASRSAFISEWKKRLDGWRASWPVNTTLLKIKYQHVHLLLLSITLRLPGPVLPILEEAERSALETLRIVRSFQIVSLQHVSNPVVKAIAYAATVLLKFMLLSRASPNLVVAGAETRELCATAVVALRRVVSGRRNCESLAAVQSARIHSLLTKLEERATDPPQLPTLPIAELAMEPSGYDSSFFDLHSSELYECLNSDWQVSNFGHRYEGEEVDPFFGFGFGVPALDENRSM